MLWVHNNSLPVLIALSMMKIFRWFAKFFIFLFLQGVSNEDIVESYEHIEITSYEDFLIKGTLDADMDLITMRPSIARKKIEETLRKHPQRC